MRAAGVASCSDSQQPVGHGPVAGSWEADDAVPQPSQFASGQGQLAAAGDWLQSPPQQPVAWQPSAPWQQLSQSPVQHLAG